MECYYRDESCAGELWECLTCGEFFCQTHWHRTTKGENVECCACEYNRDDFERDYGQANHMDSQEVESGAMLSK